MSGIPLRLLEEATQNANPLEVHTDAAMGLQIQRKNSIPQELGEDRKPGIVANSAGPALPSFPLSSALPSPPLRPVFSCALLCQSSTEEQEAVF